MVPTPDQPIVNPQLVTITGPDGDTNVTKYLYEDVGDKGEKVLTDNAIDANIWPPLTSDKKQSLREAVGSGEVVKSSELSTASQEKLKPLNNFIEEQSSYKTFCQSLGLGSLIGVATLFGINLLGYSGDLGLAFERTLSTPAVKSALYYSFFLILQFGVASKFIKETKKELLNKARMLKFFERN